jgi:hypothetical protein
MKIRVFLCPLAAFGLGACASLDQLNQPIGDSGGTNPLYAPGSRRASSSVATAPPSFTPGQFVKAVMDNTAFFAKRPNGSADADKLLKLNTPMKVVSDDGTYVKVELDGGEVGYVPSVMVFDPNAPAAGLPGAPGDLQPVQPLPPAPVPPLPTGAGGDALPIVAPIEAPPADAMPTVVDPSAPATTPAASPPPTGGTDGSPKPEGEKKP